MSQKRYNHCNNAFHRPEQEIDIPDSIEKTSPWNLDELQLISNSKALMNDYIDFGSRLNRELSGQGFYPFGWDGRGDSQNSVLTQSFLVELIP